MMDKPSSAFWRVSAVEYRDIAHATADAMARRIYLKLSENCETLAWRQDRMAESVAEKPN